MCEQASVHYQNCLLLKIKLNFVLLCLLFTSSFFLIALFVNNPTSYGIGLRAGVVLLNFVFLKMVVVLIYERVKYKDDGREIVGLVEFVTIHVTFPVLNGWISYMLAYQLMIILAQSCPYGASQNYQFC